MHLDPLLSLAGLVVGFVIGLTGMGGGALMTPVLVLGFGIPPLAAVSSDLVASVVIKPIGGAVHLRRATVRMGIVGWLALGSVPAALMSALVLSAVGSDQIQDLVKILLGLALLVAATGVVVKSVIQARRGRDAEAAAAHAARSLLVRPLPTVLVGVVGGLVVGLTSIGSGSLMIVALMLLYPTLTTAELVGTDLVQAVPLVVAAALGHLAFGDVHFDVTTSLVLGSIPGVYLGARVSSRAPDRIVRPTLALVLAGTALKLLGVL